MTTVELRDNEDQDQLYRRFKKKVIRSGILSEVRKRRFFMSRRERRRMEKKKAIRKLKRRQGRKAQSKGRK